MLGPARETRRPLAIAALASLRIGMLAAVLLGPAAAVGIGTRLPGLVTGPRDAFVVALYLGAAVRPPACSRVAARHACWWRRLAGRIAAAQPGVSRSRPASRSRGACLAYLTLWWDASTLSAAPARVGLLWTALALAFASPSACCSDTSSPSASLAVSVARGASDVATRGVPGTSRRR